MKRVLSDDELIFKVEDVQEIKKILLYELSKGYKRPWYDYIMGDVEDLEKDIYNFGAQFDLEIL